MNIGGKILIELCALNLGQDISDGVNIVTINKQIDNTKALVTNSGISASNFKKLDNKIGKTSVFGKPASAAEHSIEWQKALDSIKMEGAVKKAYFEG
jgi:hypothetical protein